MFNLISKYQPSGDQPDAIKKLVEGIKEGKKYVQIIVIKIKIGKKIFMC